jgi:hypothetical protein
MKSTIFRFGVGYFAHPEPLFHPWSGLNPKLHPAWNLQY